MFGIVVAIAVIVIVISLASTSNVRCLLVLFYILSLVADSNSHLISWHSKQPDKVTCSSLVKNLPGSLKICQDLTKIFKEKDLHRILERSLKDLQRFFTSGIPPYDLEGNFKDVAKILENLDKDLQMESLKKLTKIFKDP